MRNNIDNLNWEQPCPKCGETIPGNKAFLAAWGKFKCDCGKTFKPIFKQRPSEPNVKITGGGFAERTCACGCDTKFMARVADVNRGWGLYANKSHKATAQERRTGQHHDFKEREEIRKEGEWFGYVDDNYGHPFSQGADGHGQL